MNLLRCMLLSALFSVKASGFQSAPLREQSKLLPADSSAVQLRAIDTLSLSKFYSNSEFLYDRELPATLTLWERVKFWAWQRLSELLSSRARVTFWKIFPYVFVAGVLVFVMMHLLKADLGSVFYKTKSQNAAPAGVDITNFHAVNFDPLIAEALAARQYRLAVRYLFLQTLQRLADQKLVAWQADKTNHDYLRELRASNFHQPFQKLVWWFEYVWYGDFPVNEALFARAQSAFRAFERKQGTTANERELTRIEH